MTVLTNYLHKQEELKKIQAELARLREDEAFQEELKFKEALEALMATYGKKPLDVVTLLEPGRATDKPSSEKSTSAWPMKTFTNPHSGESVQARNTNHKTLRAWKEQYGAETVKSWAVY